MMLAISLLNWNGINDTICCVDSVLNSTFTDFVIFLFDNGSTNNEYEKLVNRYGNNKKIIINKSDINLGFTGGNNFNINEVMNQGKFTHILLLNNDCIVEKNFLKKFLGKIENYNFEGIFGPIVDSPKKTIQAAGSHISLWSGNSVRLKGLDGYDYKQVDYVTGSCMLIPTSLVEKIGLLFSKFFIYREESDFCLRAHEAGVNTYVINLRGVIHKEEIANNKIKPYYTYLMFRNRIIFLKRHSSIFQYIVSYIFLVGYLIFLFPKKFGFSNYKYAFRGIFDGIKNIGGPFIDK